MSSIPGFTYKLLLLDKMVYLMADNNDHGKDIQRGQVTTKKHFKNQKNYNTQQQQPSHHDNNNNIKSTEN